MTNTILLLSFLSLAGSCRHVAAQQEGWYSEYVIPLKQNESCPIGSAIPCGSVIDVNGTILNYERENMTFSNSTIPSKDCVWTIRGPPGTSISMKTTCYHQVHSGNDTEYDVCWSYSNTVGPVTSSRSCGIGYMVIYIAPINEEDFTVYYKNGGTYAMGFTTEITFLGEPTPTTTPTTAPEATSAPESTTSHAFTAKLNCAVYYVILITLLTAQIGFRH